MEKGRIVTRIVVQMLSHYLTGFSLVLHVLRYNPKTVDENLPSEEVF